MVRGVILCLCLLVPTLVSADTGSLIGEKHWFIDLGGKTADIVGSVKSLTGVRAGIILPNSLNVGVEAFTLTKQRKSEDNQNYRKQSSYNYFGAHIEYSYVISDRLLLIPGCSAGVGTGTYEEKNADVISSTDKTYTSVEPSVSLSVRAIGPLWLVVGGSYFQVNDEPGLKSGASLNIFARYLW
jgi:hypothetical protein